MPRIRPAAISVALLLIAAVCTTVNSAAYGPRPFIPKIEDSVGWQLSEGCRVYKFGILTEPDCDILTGEGVTVQITRVRILSLPPGQDDRPIIGIQVQPRKGDWAFSSPFAVLLIAGKSYSPAHIDNALVFDGSDRPVFTEKLQPSQPRYELPNGEKRFFRLRFSVSQTELRNGFTLQVTGLQMEGHAVRVPLLQFE
jgi:hypothetical protein